MTMPESIRCPECDTPMTQQTAASMAFEVCGGCGGIWFGRNQLKQIVDQGEPALDKLMGFEPKEAHAAPRHSTLSCPECKIVLHQNDPVGVPNVSVETCYSCGGIYLKAATLDAMDQAARDPSTPPLAAPQTDEDHRLAAAMDTMVANDNLRTAALMRWMYPCYGRPAFRDSLQALGLAGPGSI
jgi:Zn-finger nucleic acid-binding protein